MCLGLEVHRIADRNLKRSLVVTDTKAVLLQMV